MGKLQIGPKHLLAKASQVISYEANTVFKTVEVPVERIIEVPVEKIVEVIKEIPTIVEREVIKYVEVPVERIVEVEKRVEVPVVQIVEKTIEVPKEVVKYIDRLIIKTNNSQFIVGLLWVETALVIALLVSKFV